MSELEDKFMDSVKKMRDTEKNISDEDRLYLYGLFKRVTEGICNDPAPWSIQTLQYERWQSWYKNNKLDKNTAIQLYIQKVFELI